MGIRIPALLEAILEATATKTNAEARIAGLRTVLDTEARRRYAEEGAAPSWKRRDLGAVRLDEPGEWRATVADPAAFGSYVAQHHPTEATGVIEVPADRLAEALDALMFAGIELVESRVEVRATFATKYLEGLLVDVEEQADDDGSVDRTITVVDPATGAIVDGLSANRAPAKLVVTLDRDLRAATIADAQAAAEAVLREVAEQDANVVPGRFPQVAPDSPLPVGDNAPGPGPFTDEEGRPVGREVTLDELTRAGIVTPASALGDGLPVGPVGLRDREQDDAGRYAGHRIPYVGEGADGARRSAQIDREEIDGLDLEDPRVTDLRESADRWDQQAENLEALALLPTAADPYAVLDDPASTATPTEADVADAVAGIDAVEAMDNREALRRLARAKGIPAGGTKRELAERLYAAGVRA